MTDFASKTLKKYMVFKEHVEFILSYGIYFYNSRFTGTCRVKDASASQLYIISEFDSHLNIFFNDSRQFINIVLHLVLSAILIRIRENSIILAQEFIILCFAAL